MIYVLGHYKLDTHCLELRRGGQLCKLEPQECNILTYLIEHRERVVTKEELSEHVWPAPFVGEVTLSHRVMTVRCSPPAGQVP